MKRELRSLTKQEMVDLIKGEVLRRGSQRILAKDIGVSDAYVSDILLGKRGIGPAILHFLGYCTEIRYVKWGK